MGWSPRRRGMRALRGLEIAYKQNRLILATEDEPICMRLLLVSLYLGAVMVTG